MGLDLGLDGASAVDGLLDQAAPDLRSSPDTANPVDLGRVPDLPAPIDSDGDGLEDADDLCPCAADPSNADSDGDGAGDVCDGSPDLWQARLVSQRLLAVGGHALNELNDLHSQAGAARHRASGDGLYLEGRLSL
ncbi:MAG: hypothetical protein EXR76_05245 [Myxococcales bacterium]|nr:hypothetical protein [Myxococcales bacterium]